MTTTIALVNHKGGVGKTTLAVNLGYALQQAGVQTAVLDFDPQAHATISLGLDPYRVPVNIWQVLQDGQEYPINAALLDTKFGVMCIPSHIDLAVAEMQLAGEMSRERFLRQRLKALRPGVEVILIDCPPSLGLLTVNALTAADAFLVPLQCELLALEGLRDLLRTTNKVQENTNPDLEMAGLVITMWDKEATTCREVTDRIREIYGPLVWTPPVGRFRELVKMRNKGPLGSYYPDHAAARAFTALAQEVLRYAEAAR